MQVNANNVSNILLLPLKQKACSVIFNPGSRSVSRHFSKTALAFFAFFQERSTCKSRALKWSVNERKGKRVVELKGNQRKVTSGQHSLERRHYDLSQLKLKGRKEKHHELLSLRRWFSPLVVLYSILSEKEKCGKEKWKMERKSVFPAEEGGEGQNMMTMMMQLKSRERSNL